MMSNKKGQAVKTILVFGMVIIGLFIVISMHPVLSDVIQDYVNNHPTNTFTNIIIQIIPFAIVLFLILLVFIPEEVSLFGN